MPHDDKIQLVNAETQTQAEDQNDHLQNAAVEAEKPTQSLQLANDKPHDDHPQNAAAEAEKLTQSLQLANDIPDVLPTVLLAADRRRLRRQHLQ
jgi:hypothetical protein